MQLLREQIPPLQKQQWDEAICRELLHIVAERSVRSVHTYLPMGQEVNIYPFVEQMLDRGVTVICPESLPNRRLRNLVLYSTERLKPGVFGTRYPDSGECYTGSYDLIVVPGLAFDQYGNRLGYGAGYYDLFLSEHPGAYKVGVAYPFQLVEQLPVEPHDIPMDQLLTGTKAGSPPFTAVE